MKEVDPNNFDFDYLYEQHKGAAINIIRKWQNCEFKDDVYQSGMHGYILAIQKIEEEKIPPDRRFFTIKSKIGTKLKQLYRICMSTVSNTSRNIKDCKNNVDNLVSMERPPRIEDVIFDKPTDNDYKLDNLLDQIMWLLSKTNRESSNKNDRELLQLMGLGYSVWGASEKVYSNKKYGHRRLQLIKKRLKDHKEALVNK